MALDARVDVVCADGNGGFWGGGDASGRGEEIGIRS